MEGGGNAQAPDGNKTNTSNNGQGSGGSGSNSKQKQESNRVVHNSPLNSAVHNNSQDPVILKQASINNTIMERHDERDDESCPSLSDSQDDISSAHEEPNSQAQLAEERQLKKKQGRRGRRWCQKFSIFNSKAYLFFQLGFQAVYFILLLITIFCHSKNQSDLLARNSAAIEDQNLALIVPVQPHQAKELETLRERSDLIDQIALLEAILLAVLVVDLLTKLGNHHSILMVNKAEMKKRKGRRDDDSKDKVDVLFDTGFIYLKGEPVLATSIVALDSVLVLVMVLLFVVERLMSEKNKLEYL
mmetsp:Transcript_707/g.1304  ORF Transcript_707/g.1304 Transcript_707/m.1304 type:complete len:302 (-) Transcript_707:1540-2445(-)